MSYGDRDPIAALATARGESALAVIRTTGEGSLALLERRFSRPRALREAAGHRAVHGWLLGAAGERLDEVVVTVYRAPRSYTGEEGAEITCHGGLAAGAALEALLAAGFREALRGEFSFRAFMNGKIDLTRAESVMEMVAARTGRARERAARRLSGDLAGEIGAVRAGLLQALAAVELRLDYASDEFFADDASDDAAGGGVEKIPEWGLAVAARGRLAGIAGAWRREILYAEGVLAVIAGRPNAGKSSLFNALLREDRSIVTDVPGTTRDWIEASVAIEGIPTRLVDTAGLRGEAESEAERLGVERSREMVDQAGLVLYVVDGAAGFTPADDSFLTSAAAGGGARPVIVVWNKADLARPPDSSPYLAVSARTGEGIATLCREAARLLTGPGAGAGDPGDDALGPGSRRQQAALNAALEALDEALAAGGAEGPVDLVLVASPLRRALDSLGEITGEVTTGEILNEIFSRFCVGK